MADDLNEDDEATRCQKKNRRWRCKEKAMDGRILCEKHQRSYQNLLEKLRRPRMAKAGAGTDSSMPGNGSLNDHDCVVLGVDDENAGLFTDACKGNGGGVATECAKRDSVTVVGVGDWNVVEDCQDGGVTVWCGGGGGPGVLPRKCGWQQEGLVGEASGDGLGNGSASLPPKRGRPFGSKDKLPRKRRSRKSGEVLYGDDVGRAETKNEGDTGAITPKKRGRQFGSKNWKRENLKAVDEGTSREIVWVDDEENGGITVQLWRLDGQKSSKSGGAEPVAEKNLGWPLGSKNGEERNPGDVPVGSEGEEIPVLKKKRGRPLGSKNKKTKNQSDGNVGLEGEKNPDNGGSELVSKKKPGRPLGSKNRKKRSPNDGNVGTNGEENAKDGGIETFSKKKPGRPFGSKNRKHKNSGSEPSETVCVESVDVMIERTGGLPGETSKVLKDGLEQPFDSENLKKKSVGGEAEGESGEIACVNNEENGGIAVLPRNPSEAENSKNGRSELPVKERISRPSRLKNWKQRSSWGDNEGIMKRRRPCPSASKSRKRKSVKKGNAKRKGGALAHISDFGGKTVVVCALEGKEGFLREKADKGIGKVQTFCENHGKPSGLEGHRQRKVAKMVQTKVRSRNKLPNRRRGRRKGSKSIPSVGIEDWNRGSAESFDIEQVRGLQSSARFFLDSKLKKSSLRSIGIGRRRLFILD